MTSSMASAMSGMTVSCFGEDDVDFEEAVNKVFADLQTFVNDMQCGVRTLAMCEEQDNNYMEALKIWKTLDNDVMGALGLFTELRSISKQVLGKPPSAVKEEVKAQLTKWKTEAKMEKDRAKNERTEEKKE
jgi:hypothetical protein